MDLFSKPEGQGWPQICQLLLAVGFSAAIGIERQLRHKSAGLRTNTLVGTGSALFMLISKYGFMDILSRYQVVVDPSRIAAQIVSGIGFIGGGIIFKQQNDVRGLTTAAAVWLTAAIGSACGAGLPILASLTTALYFITVIILPYTLTVPEKLRSRNKTVETSIMVRYRSLHMGLEPILERVLKAGAETVHVKRIDEVVLSSLHSPVLGANLDGQSIHQRSTPADSSPLPPPMISQGHTRIFDLQLTLSGHQSPNEVVCFMSQLPSIISISIDNESTDEV